VVAAILTGLWLNLIGLISTSFVINVNWVYLLLEVNKGWSLNVSQ